MLTHYNLANNAMTVADMRSTDPGDVVSASSLFSTIFGQTSAFNSSIYLGLTIRLWPHFDPGELFLLLKRRRAQF